ncbi:RagB/SusD family nutrient uptake outer membrane protein [Deminuibacter soli]|uniref:RagB/SusD family nutrient uptake outer membrane protein n=1 Tax=Deminuibacter soli TaxID=2291815 RepID=A0A3E1NPD0_9BACT|nr:RagB/SusD family nutrient uptake outer membrane protein [Deminuibacter soli]RFM29773.1 RagB/SusD family nutrient uptake outer membrane protein [Deminuibacter soli]
MKKLNILFYGALALALTSCKKDFLERAPLSNVSDAEFWKSPNDLQLYCNNFYNTEFPSYTGYGTIGIYGLDADQGSDNQIQGDGYNTTMNGEAVVPPSGGGWTWTSLRNINYLLTHYSRVSAPWTSVAPYVGEARFFRAQFYFNMLKTFGDLPWINQPVLQLDDPALYAARVSRTIIADSIIADLDSAISYLPAKSKAATSRVYKELAMALASRVALYEGTWEKYHAGTPFGVAGSDGSKYLNKAAQVAGTLIDAGVFSLDNVGAANGYWNLFNQTDFSSSKEVMFWRRYQVGIITQNWARYTLAGAARGVTKDLVDSYLCVDGQPISRSALYKGDDSLTMVVTNRDPRLAQTIYVPDGKHIITNNAPSGAVTLFTVPELDGGGTASCPTGYQTYKGHNPDYYQQYAQDVGITGLILYRYAEVLLNYAEAKAELGTISQADLDKSINKLRQRVAMPNLNLAGIITDPKWTFPTLSGIINEVRRERRVELACEGFRHDDINRWAAADKVLVGWKPKGAKKAQFTTLAAASALAKYPVDAAGYIEIYQNIAPLAGGFHFNVNRDYLSPIPLDQLQLNKSLTQNPGWQ